MSNNEITAADAGCWLDGHYGWHNTYRVIDRACLYGMELDETDSYIRNVYENTDGLSSLDMDNDASTILPSGELLSVASLHDCMMELSDKATEYLQSLAPEGYVFVWDAGEFSLVTEDEAEGM